MTQHNFNLKNQAMNCRPNAAVPPAASPPHEARDYETFISLCKLWVGFGGADIPVRIAL
jgi:hypothetical protein